MAAPDQMIALPAARSAEVDVVAVARGEPSDRDSDPQGSAALPGPGNGEFPGNPTTTSPSRRPRSTPSQEAPFAWQAKAALRRIVRSERVIHRGHALAVYVLLSLLQSDKETGSVTCTKGFLASQAGLGTRSVAQALLDLEALGLIEIKRTKLPGTAANAVNTYTLTSCTNCTTSCKGRSPSRARNKNNPSRPEGSLKGEERNLNPPAAAAASACAPAQQPGACETLTPAFMMSGLDD
jgi:hypothetical protein